MEKMSALFFEFSHEDRLSILLKLMEEPMKLTHLANSLDLTAQECSRQITRLTEIDLVTRNPDGAYELQPYGVHALKLFPGFEFITEHMEYFNKHTLTTIPEKFLSRIGELQNTRPVTELMSTIARIENTVEEAEEYFYYMSHETLVTAQGLERALERIDRGLRTRGIEPTTYRRPMDIDINVTDEMRESMRNHRVEGNLDNRYLEKVDVTIYMSEKEAAIISFPTTTGEYDYLGFTSKDPKVLEWCQDIYQHYWVQGIPWQQHSSHIRNF